MAMTMTQKILADHAGRKEVRAGELINAELDLVHGNDITTPVAIKAFEKAGFTKVFLIVAWLSSTTTGLSSAS